MVKKLHVGLKGYLYIYVSCYEDTINSAPTHGYKGQTMK
jgi:hypothetical protein